MRRLATAGLLAQTALLTAAYSAVRPMASYRAIELGASNVTLGLLAASFSVLPLVLAFSVGRQIDRRGPIGFVLAGNLAIVATSALAMFAGSLALLFVATAGLGLGHLFCMLGQQVRASLDENRDRAFAWLTSAAAAGQIIGLPAAAYAASVAGDGWTPATAGIAVSVVVSVVALVPALWMRRTPDSTTPAADGPPHRLAAQILRTPGVWQAFLAGGAVIAAIDLLLAYLPLWGHERGIAVGAVGLLLALRGLVTLAARIGVDVLTRTVGRRAVIAGTLVAAAGGLAALPFTGIAGAVVIMVVLGFGLGLAQPLTMAWISDVAPPGTRAAALGVRLTANRASQATLPAAIAVLTAGSGATGVFLGAAVMLAVSSATLVRAPSGSV